MKQITLTFAALLGTATLLTACDEGDISEQEAVVSRDGRVVVLTAEVAGLATWPSAYSVVLAGFSDDSDYAVIQKSLPDDAEGPVAVAMKITNDALQTVELCVTNRLRQRIVSYVSTDMTATDADTVRINAGQIDLSIYQAIQTQVFDNTCTRCHGLGSSAAAGLWLTAGESYAQLVDHPAKLESNGLRVVPGNAEASLLHRVIRGDAADVPFDHSNMIKDGNLLTLIDHWIDGGAGQ